MNDYKEKIINEIALCLLDLRDEKVYSIYRFVKIEMARQYLFEALKIASELEYHSNWEMYVKNIYHILSKIQKKIDNEEEFEKNEIKAYEEEIYRMPFPQPIKIGIVASILCAFDCMKE